MAEELMEESIAELRRLFKETDAKFKETDAQFKATDARLDKRFRETDASLRRLEALFGDQWGKLVEALVHPNALQLFRERGIQVEYVYRRAEHHVNGETMEIDLLLENGQDVVVVEVKSNCNVEDVNDFLVDLSHFLRFFPRYTGYHIYGAVAGLSFAGDADRYAYRRGLFVVGIAGEGMVQIRNNAAFRPKDFGVPAPNGSHPSID